VAGLERASQFEVALALTTIGESESSSHPPNRGFFAWASFTAWKQIFTKQMPTVPSGERGRENDGSLQIINDYAANNLPAHKLIGLLVSASDFWQSSAN
jgi:hypothetical protein